MSKYIAMYKCPMCGTVLQYGQSAEIPYDKIPELLAAVVKQQKFIGTIHYQAPMHIPHQCPDGSGGLACFAGFKKIS